MCRRQSPINKIVLYYRQNVNGGQLAFIIAFGPHLCRQRESGRSNKGA